MKHKQPKPTVCGFFLSAEEYQKMLEEMSRDYERLINELTAIDITKLEKLFANELTLFATPNEE